MIKFFNFKGWNGIVGIIVTLLPVYIAVAKIGNKKRMKLKFYLNKKENEDKKNIFGKEKISSADIYNYAMCPIFIKECWIGINKSKNLNRTNVVKLSVNRKFLNPGECMLIEEETIVNGIIDIYNKTNSYENSNSKIYFFVVNGSGRVKRFNADLNWSDIKRRLAILTQNKIP